MSRRTSTTRAYKSRRAGRAAGGERARARRGRTGKRDRPTDRRAADRDGGPGEERRALGWRAPWGWGRGWGEGGGECSLAAGGARAERTGSPVQPLPAPGCSRSHFGGAWSRGRAPAPAASPGAPAPSSRESGAKTLVLPEAHPLLPSPRRGDSAWPPPPAELGARRGSQDPRPALRRGAPSHSRPVGPAPASLCAPSAGPAHAQRQPLAFARGAVLSGPGGGGASAGPPRPTPATPPPEVPFNRDVFDVTGL